MASIKFPLNFFIFFIFYISSSLCFSTNSSNSRSYTATNELANQVCKNTSSFKFCQDAIYADPRAPSADRYVLAYIAFGGAYLNATSSSRLIESLIKNKMTKNVMLERLKKCRGYYKEAVRVIEEALGDLDSETFDELGYFAEKAGNDAKNCEMMIKGGMSRNLSKKNQDLIGLSEVCSAVSKLYGVC